MTSVLYMILGLGGLIFFHELGHFLLAKREGVKVDKFSLGFGPKLFSFKKGDTEYMLSLIPLGGYVKMAGMVDESMDTESIKGEPWEFLSKNVWQRMRIIIAGPLMNFLLAYLIFVVVGIPKPTTKIVMVEKDMPAAVSGLVAGDRIMSVNGTKVSLWNDLISQIQPYPEQPLSFIVEREGAEVNLQITPKKVERKKADGSVYDIGYIGIAPATEVIGSPKGFFGNIYDGAIYTYNVTVMTYKGIWMLLTNKISSRNVHGPIFIAKLSGELAKSGFVTFILFVALISINLAVLNLLPIPILDGGHCFFLLIEAVKGSPLSIKAQDFSQKVGMSLLLALMLYATYNDILDIFIKS